MDVSIIIPCYLMPDKDHELLGFTRTCIDSIKKYLHGYELILVDNGSCSDAYYLEQEADVYIRNKKNLGFAPAVNQGLKIAKGNYLVVCNNDIEFLNDWIFFAVSNFLPETGAISSHLHAHDPSHRARREVSNSGGMFGALWITKRDVVDKVGLLSEDYIMGMYEDKDYWKRLEKAGCELAKYGWCNHIGNATWGKLPNQHEIFMNNKKLFEARWG